VLPLCEMWPSDLSGRVAALIAGHCARRLAGRLAGIVGGVAQFSGSLPNVCALADLKLGRALNTIDAWAGAAGERFAPTIVSPAPLGLDLRSGEISTIVWATGYRPDLSWLHVPVLDRRGRVLHHGGVTACPGLYLIGMPFLRRRKSSLIDGAADDAAELTTHLAGHLDALAGRRERSAS
jgi:putative flavoprotein involved in K+ transport